MPSSKHQDKLSFGPDDGINWTSPTVEGPGGLPLYTYGEFGGPGYTGGIYQDPNTPSSLEAYGAPPVDPLDALFRLHDMAYDPGLTPPGADPSLVRAEGDLALLQGISKIPSGQMDAEASAYGGLAMLFAIGQIEFVNGHPELLSQKDIQHYTLEALHDIERGIAKLPAQEAQYFEQALAPLSDLHGSQAHIGDQHVAGPELVETVLNTFSHLFPPGTGELLA